MTDGGTLMPLGSPSMDAPMREAKLIVGRAAAHAHGLRRPVEPDVCRDCGGDGCHTCFWTGEPKAVASDG